MDAFHIAFYNDREYEMLVTGTLVEPPDRRDSYSNLTLAVEAVDSGSGDMPASGLLLVRAPALADYKYGQRVRARGLLKTPPEDEEFSYRDYLARYGIHATMSTREITVLPGNGGNFFFRHCSSWRTESPSNGTHSSRENPGITLFHRSTSSAVT